VETKINQTLRRAEISRKYYVTAWRVARCLSRSINNALGRYQKQCYRTPVRVPSPERARSRQDTASSNPSDSRERALFSFSRKNTWRAASQRRHGGFSFKTPPTWWFKESKTKMTFHLTKMRSRSTTVLRIALPKNRKSMCYCWNGHNGVLYRRHCVINCYSYVLWSRDNCCYRFRRKVSSRSWPHETVTDSLGCSTELSAYNNVMRTARRIHFEYNAFGWQVVLNGFNELAVGSLPKRLVFWRPGAKKQKTKQKIFYIIFRTCFYNNVSVGYFRIAFWLERNRRVRKNKKPVRNGP